MRHHLGRVGAVALLVVFIAAACATREDAPGRKSLTITYGIPDCPGFTVTPQTITIPLRQDTVFDLGGGNELEFGKNTAPAGSQYRIARGPDPDHAEILIDTVGSAPSTFPTQPLVLRMSYAACGFSGTKEDSLKIMRVRPAAGVVASSVHKPQKYVRGHLITLSGFAIVD